MSSHTWQQAEALFHEILDLPPAERPTRLATLPPALQAEVASLIAAFDAADQSEPRPAPSAPAPLTTIGPYHLEKELGEGGMGTVYLASRADQQYEKKVAIKVIRAGPASRALLDRFLRERQILAGMDHPYIARLLDGGLTPDGQPYLVMDYVPGTRLDRHCEQAQLPLADRILLFRKICAAVTYAHQNLVIHRDLKPSNILVTPDHEPKLLDFGIATVIHGQAAAADLTVTAGLFLTPLYASPELVRGGRISVSSDVYSLGVILYELLCGRSPYAGLNQSPADLLHAITTADPAFPSSQSPQAAELRGDLDSIVLKALAKSVEERYPSVEQLSADLGRYLAGQPVLAVKAGTAYRLKKFLRRHRLGVAATVAIVGLTLAGVAATTWQARLAERRFNEARQMAHYLLFPLFDSVQQLPGSTPVQAAMARESLAYLDRLSTARGQDPVLQTELAEGYLRAGNVFGNPFGPNLGQREQALAAYRQALALIEPLATQPSAQRTRARILLQLGGLQTFAAVRDTEGIPSARRAVAEFEALLARTPQDAELAIETASARQMLARHLGQSGGFITGGGAPEIEQHILRARALLTAQPSSPRLLRLLTLNYQISAINKSSANPNAALADYSQAIAHLERIPAPDRDSLDVRRLRASLLANRGWDYGQTNQFPLAIADFEAASEILLAISAADPRNAAALYHTTGPFRNLGIVHNYAGQKPAAITAYRRVISIYDRLLTIEPGNAHHALHRAEILVRLGDLLAQTGQPALAHQAAAEGLAHLVHLANQPNAADAQLLDAARWLLLTEVLALRQPTQALAFARRASKQGHMADEYLAEALHQTGDSAGALVAIEGALSQVAPPAPGEKPSRARAELEAARERYRAKAAKK